MAALIVLVGGVVFVFCAGPSLDRPVKTTTAIEAGLGKGGGAEARTVRLEKAHGSTTGKTTTKKVERPLGDPAGKWTQTVEESPRSFPESILGTPGSFLIQIGLVVLAAFLAGAFLQRILVGEFSLKIGGLELGQLQETTLDVTNSLVDITAEVASIKQAQGSLAAGDRAFREELQTPLAKLGAMVSLLNDRVVELERGGRDGR